MNHAGHQLLLNCLETLQRALKGEARQKDKTKHGKIYKGLREQKTVLEYLLLNIQLYYKV